MKAEHDSEGPKNKHIPKGSTAWEYILDDEKKRVHQYRLNCHYYDTIYNQKLIKTVKVAEGITAFIYSDYRHDIIGGVFDKLRAFTRYYNDIKGVNLPKFYDDSIADNDEVAFCSAHMEDEKNKLNESQMFYTPHVGHTDNHPRNEIKAAAEGYLNWLSKHFEKISGKHPGRKPKKPMKIEEVFNPPYNHPAKIQGLKELLHPDFVDKQGQWNSGGPKNEITVLYQYIEGQKIISDKETRQDRIVCFYGTFGKTIADKQGPGIYTTIKNATTEVNNPDLKKFFDDLLKSWFK